MADYLDYFRRAVEQGQTGTGDPTAAGLGDPWTSATISGMPPVPPVSAPSDPAGGWQGLISKEMLQRFGGALMGGGIAGYAPADFYPQPPAMPAGPAQEYQAPFMPAASQQPGLSQGGAGARVLANLAQQNGVAAPPGAGGSISDYIKLPIAGQPGSTPWSGGAPGQPQAGGTPAQSTAVPQPATPAMAQPNSALGNNILAAARAYQNSGLADYTAPPSLKPSFHDNLLRFGLATMAAGGKPMATTLGAIGEGGLSTYDANQTAKQADITNTLNARKAAIGAQTPAMRAYEVLDQLQQRSADRIMSIAAMQQTRQDAIDLKLAIAGGNQALIQQKIDEIAQHNREMEANRAGAAEDRAARTAETADKNAGDFYQRQMAAAAKANPIGVPPEAELKATRDTAVAHPQSVYATQWATLKATQLDNARQLVADHPDQKPKVIQKLRQMGIDPREL